jgi:GT2 family glycosyltransferase
VTSSVYVVILTWNHIEDTIECLDSVLSTTYTETKIIVVDNASIDNTVETITAKYPSVILLQNQENLGYAEGNNVGIRYALKQNADFLFVLNNDTVIGPDTISLLVNDLLENQNAIAVSPKSYFYDCPEKVYFAGGYITETGETKHLTNGPYISQSYQTEWLNGCALLIRSAYIKDVGYFDPDYFLLFEDTDWSLRARRCGYELRVVPGCKIFHKAAVSFNGRRSPEYVYYYTRNSNLWYEHNFSFRQRIKFHGNTIKKDFSTLKDTLKILLAYTPIHKAIRQAYFDYIVRRFNKRNYVW